MVRRLALLALLLGPLPALAEDSGWKIAPRPDWVRDVGWERPSGLPQEAPSGGVDYLLFDLQMDQRGRPATYIHTVKHLVDQVGVQSDSQVKVSFDSLYQEVHLHGIRIYRDGETLERLASASLDVNRQDSNREEEIYHATRSIRAYLDDVRVGDVLEYEYTLFGENPVFGGHYLDSISLRWHVPIGRVYRSLIWPADRAIHFLPRRTERTPEKHREGDTLRFVWDESQVPALLVDGDLPAWYDPTPWTQVSTFNSWAEVVGWGRALFSLPDGAPTGLKQQVLELAGDGADAASLTTAALRVVQDEIRYLYIGLAESSHRPSPPDLVVERRFGDCKDKSLLLATLLRDLGVDATPALVSTDWKGRVAELLPSPLDFDHVIVRVRIDGQSYWVDGTATHQRGSLDRLVPPSWGVALVLEEGVDALEPILVPELTEAETDIRARFELGDGMEPVELFLETTYRGRKADSTRYSLRSRSPAEIQRDYVEFYADIYPLIEAAAPVTWEDEAETNLLQVVEQYRIPDFWELDEAGEWAYSDLYPLELEYLLASPTTPVRSMPLGIDHPIHLHYVIEARIDDGWSVPDSEVTVEDDAFVFEKGVETEGDLLRIDYRYRSKIDHLPAEAGPDHTARIDEAFDQISFPIQLPLGVTAAGATGLAGLNWPIALVAFLVFGLAIALAHRLYRWQPLPLPIEASQANRAKEGLGGWLALLGVGLIASPVKIGIEISSALSTYSLPVWTSLTAPGSAAYDPLWAPVLLGEMVLNIFLLVFSVLVLTLYFKKRKAFPMVLVAFLLAAPAALWIDAILASQIATIETTAAEVTELVGLAGRSLIWSWYALVSVRVRKTFVH